MTRLGIYVNNRAAVVLGDGFDAAAMLALAHDAELAGLDFLAVGDSVLAKPRLSPLPVLSAIAGATDRIGLTTGILQPHLRHPVTLAQEIATLCQLSGGRLSLGVGLGTGPRELVDSELALVGLTRRRRARAFAEAIQVVRLLCAGEPVTFVGDEYRLEQVDIGYRPPNGDGLSIAIACGAFVPHVTGHGPNDIRKAIAPGTFAGPLDRVAQLGGGWITGMATPAEWARAWAAIVDAADAYGRDVGHDGFERRLNVNLHIGEDERRARRAGQAFLEAYHRLPMDDETLDRWLITGTPERCAQRLRDYTSVGVNSFQLILADVDQHAQLARVAEELVPLMREVRA